MPGFQFSRVRPRFLTLLSIALFAAGSAATALAAPEERLGSDVVPTFQSIHLTMNPDEPDYSGRVHVELDVRNPVSSFRLHAKDLSIETVTLKKNGKPLPIRHELATQDGLLRIQSDAPFSKGPLELDISFRNSFDTHSISLYRMETGGQGYVFTQMEPDDAREAFPCWDEPSFKIPYQLTLELPEADEGVTNTPIETVTKNGDTKTIVYQRTKPLPTYLLAIAAGPFEFTNVPGTSIPTRVVTVAGQSQLTGLAVELTPPLLLALESYFDSRYPYEKLDLIAVPEYWPGAMENAGAITFSDIILLLDSRAASVAEKRRLARIMAHEIAHMWFGDLVTMEWWDDLWLNESFADWMGDKITDQVFPEFQLPPSELLVAQGTMGFDARSSAIAIRQPVEHSADALHHVGLAYYKGKRVLGMFEQWMGPDTFRRGVLDYIRANEWGNASADDLWKALAAASKQEVAPVMGTFIEQPGLPLVTTEVLSDGNVRIMQKRFTGSGQDLSSLSWQIPVGLRYSSGKTVESRTVLLTGAETIVPLGLKGPAAWVMPNLNARGYYRWTLPATALRSLAGNAGSVLEPIERIELLANAGALLGAGAIDGATYLEILSGAAHDPDPLVTGALVDGLGLVRESFIEDGMSDEFAAYVRATLRPALDRIGLEPRAGEKDGASLLRPTLVTWLGRNGRDEEVLQFAERTTRTFMADPGSVDRALAGASIQVAALRGDRALFDEYRTRFENAQNPGDRRRYLQALGLFGDPELQHAALQYSLEGPLRSHEILIISQSLSTVSEAAGEAAYRWTVQNFNAIASRIPPEVVAFMPFSMHGCSETRFQEGEAFFSDASRAVEGTAQQIRQVRDAVQECATLRKREAKTVAEFLGRQTHRSD